MRFFLLAVAFLLVPLPVSAGQAEVRDFAKQNNCPPKKIEILRQSIGADGEVTYKIQCNLPKATEQATEAASTLIAVCRLNLCRRL